MHALLAAHMDNSFREVVQPRYKKESENQSFFYELDKRPS